MTALQRLDERPFVYHRSSPDVHEVSARLRGAYSFGIDEVPGLGGARQRYGHVVGFAQGVVQPTRDVELVGVLPRGVVLAHRPLDPDDAHPERPRAISYGAPDVPHPDDAQDLALQGAGVDLPPGFFGLVAPQPVEVLGVLEHGHEDELGERVRVDAARGRYHDVRLQEPGVLRHLARSGHARLHPPQPGRDLREVPDVPRGEVVENLGLPEHGQEFLLFLRRAAPTFRARVIPRPSRRWDEVLPVEDPQPPVHVADAPDMLVLEVASYDYGDQFASLRSAAFQLVSLSAYWSSC